MAGDRRNWRPEGSGVELSLFPLGRVDFLLRLVHLSDLLFRDRIGRPDGLFFGTAANNEAQENEGDRTHYEVSHEGFPFD
jgi:hypothetical protein